MKTHTATVLSDEQRLLTTTHQPDLPSLKTRLSNQRPFNALSGCTHKIKKDDSRARLNRCEGVKGHRPELARPTWESQTKRSWAVMERRRHKRHPRHEDLVSNSRYRTWQLSLASYLNAIHHEWLGLVGAIFLTGLPPTGPTGTARLGCCHSFSPPAISLRDVTAP